MVSSQMSQLLHDLTTKRDSGLTLPSARLRACAMVLGLDGLAVSLTQPGDSTELLRHTGERAAQLEDIQFTQGQGPGLEAARTGLPVTEPDLTTNHSARWPGLVPELLALGVRAVFAYPLALGTVRLGVLTGHRTTAGALSGEQDADARALAQRLTLMLLDRAASPHDPTVWLTETSHLHRAEVHQATGMVAKQLDVSPAEALVRIRAHSFHTGRPLLETARAILARELFLTANHPPAGDNRP
ncbi:ANTAR domain-containing protein [Streptomyces sp. S.PB5]|uniref:ANTAR domain-containing protein n=1 Tax=Streptomyces sp. S.PB5 TaxID=3020844 RepID=UPI0025AED8DD|nr:ANTAR domain-containing protein [Streptomyces sp. S.PB5]MDN3028992.1 ANTAR domain-containing protein [Streptomyces sp. S.PB5]